ncbi:MAG: DUF5683 domain-containing protein [Bacteroides sp.]|jgi:hypothetical protein|nr:DUF5683 domain-containing protein [Bacteroides sp.]MCI1681091.1 DUF5683 domain-containing protein [Bacteroides sp.]
MTTKRKIYQWSVALLLCIIQTAGIAIYGQDRPRAAAKRMQSEKIDSVQTKQRHSHHTTKKDRLRSSNDSITNSPYKADSIIIADSIALENKKKLLEITSNPALRPSISATDSLQKALKKKNWVPNSATATWIALVIPGGGQIYNRKYWKLPIIYGGFAGCAYALSWNNKMYKDYSQAYRDAANGNIKATSITDLLPAGYSGSLSDSQLTELLRKRKDLYRRYRDLSIFSFIGVYLLSVIDAYVDAELSNFDITPDLSMHVAPSIIDSQTYNKSLNKSVGIQCSFRF